MSTHANTRYPPGGFGAPKHRRGRAGSTFGYSEKSLSAVVDAVGPQDAARIVSGNVKRFLGLS
jgi:hypothetical protein